MFLPLALIAIAGPTMAALAFYKLKDELYQATIQKGIQERAGFYPKGCSCVQDPGKIVECGHNYCQMLRNAR
jgi:hypothetical protein